jgi:hypothetical protein
MKIDRAMMRVRSLHRVRCALVAVMSIASVAAAESGGLPVRGASIACDPAVRRGVVSPLQRSFSLLDHAPHPISLVEVLYEATRTLDAGGGALKLIENFYEDFFAQWKLKVHPRIERLAALSFTDEEVRSDTAREPTRDAHARALKEAWDVADSLHEAFIARVIEACVSPSGLGAVRPDPASNATAHANFRGRIAQRVAFADGESFLIDRLPLVAAPCVDLAVALAHPRVTQRIPTEQREMLAAMLAAEWPRILREHHTLREIGFKFAGAEFEAIAVDDAATPHASIRATEDALRAIAALARGNLAANLAFADHIERAISVDAADALRVELISNSCRDGGFASAIAEPWQRTERALRRDSRGDGVSLHDDEMRALREQRHQFVLGCVTQFRRFVAEDRAFASSFESTDLGEHANAALLRGEHPCTEELIARFEQAAQVLPESLRGIDHGSRENAQHSDEREVAGYRISAEDAADTDGRWETSPPMMLYPSSETNDTSSDASSDDSDEASSDNPAAFTIHDARRVSAALALDGITKSPTEVAAFLDAFLASDSVARETLTRRAHIPAYPRFAIAPTLARDMPEVVTREEAFDASRAAMLEAACEMPTQGIGRVVLGLERLTHFIFEGDPVFGRAFPDSILACAARAGLDRDAQRALFQHAQPEIQALLRDAANLAQEARAASLRDAAKEAQLRADAVAATGEEESLMDRLLRGGEVDDEINACTERTRRKIVEIFLKASNALFAEIEAEQKEQRRAVQRFQVFWIDRMIWLSRRSTIQTLESIAILRKMAQSNELNAQGVLARLEACEEIVLNEALELLLPLATTTSSRADDTQTAWTHFWTILEGTGEIRIEVSRPPIAGFVEGHHMRLLLEAVEVAPKKQRLQRMIARRYEYALGRLRQTPFADVFHP